MIKSISPSQSADVEVFWRNVLKHSIIPRNDNPMDDDNGSRFDRLEGHGNLVFFPGNDAEDHTRNIRTPIPSNKRLFFAVNPVIITDEEVKDQPDKDLSSNAKKDEDTASLAILRIREINGKEEVIDLIAKKYRVSASNFDVTFPQNGGRWGVSGGIKNASADGYYVIIELERGEYSVDIDAVVDQPFPFNLSTTWTSKVTYNFKVV